MAVVNNAAVNTGVHVSFKISVLGEFPGSPVVRTALSLPKAWAQSLVGELRSHEPHGVTKKNNNNKIKLVFLCFSDIYPGIELLGRMVALFLAF